MADICRKFGPSRKVAVLGSTEATAEAKLRIPAWPVHAGFPFCVCLFVRLFVFICMGVLPAWIPVHHLCMPDACKKPEDDIGFPTAEAVDS